MTSHFETPAVEAWSPRLQISPEQIALAHLAVRRNQEIVGTNTFSDIYDSQPDLKDLENYYISTGGNFFVATTADGQLKGFVGLRNDDDGQATLKRLAVLSEFEGQGVGTSLVSQLITWATDQDFRLIKLQTGGNEQAKDRIYEKLGFVVTGIVHKPNKADEWLMELLLT